MHNRCGKKNDSKQSESKTPQQNVEYKAGNTLLPVYSNELLIYQNETLQNTEEFRKARKTWIESNAHEKIETYASEDATHKANLYKGRCKCLRIISFKVTLHRRHRKTVRPIRLFSLKSKLSKQKVKRSPAQSQESVSSTLNKTKDKDYPVYPARDSSISEIGSPVSEESCQIKIETDDDSSRKLFKPSKKAIKKLKAAKANAEKEPYSCYEGRDLTVVLKNVCPNYKRVLKRSKIKKVVDEYSRLTDEDVESKERVLCQLTDEDVESKERILCQLTDSLQIHKKNKNKKQTCPDDVNGSDFEVTVGSVKSEKALFTQLRDSLEIHRRRVGRGKKREESQSREDKSGALSKANETFGEEKLDKKDKDEDDGKKVSLVTLHEALGRAFTKEGLIKMGRMCEETIIVKL